MGCQGKINFFIPVFIILLLGLALGGWYYFSAQKASAIPAKPKHVQKIVKKVDPFSKVIKLQIQKGVNLVCKGPSGWIFVGQDTWNPVRDEGGEVLIYTDQGIYAANSCFEVVGMERHSIEENGTFYRVLRLHTVKILPGQPAKKDFLMRDGEVTPISS